MNSDFTIGVEEEYQIVDATTGVLCSRAHEVLADAWTDEIRPELQDTTLEIGTRVCSTIAELDHEIRRLRFMTATAVATLGCEIIAAGVHPFSRWEDQVTTSTGRYAAILERYRRVARDEHNFGMHIHIGIPTGIDRIRIINSIRRYLPHLIALASSSPFFEAEDTGYASYRMVLWRRWPNAGIPPRLSSEREYHELAGLLIASDVIGDERGLYWGIRPHSIYPTIEFRVTDACPSLDDAVAIAALCRALVVAVASGRLAEPPRRRIGAATEEALLTNNEWLAIRYGLDAWTLDPDTGEPRIPIRRAIRRLLDELAYTLGELGDLDILEQIEMTLTHGNAAERMRRIANERGGTRPLVDWLIRETNLGTGIDRRRTQRTTEEPTPWQGYRERY